VQSTERDARRSARRHTEDWPCARIYTRGQADVFTTYYGVNHPEHGAGVMDVTRTGLAMGARPAALLLWSCLLAAADGTCTSFCSRGRGRGRR